MKATLLVSVLVLCGLGVCWAQVPPTPPSMPDTFEASGEIEFHGAEATFFGKFVIARDQAKEMGYERDEFEQGLFDVAESVQRYDMNKTYFLRGRKSELHCVEEDRNFNGMPKFWGWLTTATYEGTTTIREIVYDSWATMVGNTEFEFGKPRTNSSILYFYRRKNTEDGVFYSIMNFKTVPDPRLFSVPPECKQEEKW